MLAAGCRPQLVFIDVGLHGLRDEVSHWPALGAGQSVEDRDEAFGNLGTVQSSLPSGCARIAAARPGLDSLVESEPEALADIWSVCKQFVALPARKRLLVVRNLVDDSLTGLGKDASHEATPRCHHC